MTVEDWKDLNAAVYLRRSQGETGSTKEQLKRIEKKIQKLVKEGKIKPLNPAIVGRDINGKIKFKAERDLAIIGDYFNEGNGMSGFKFEERPVLVKLLDETRSGKYDVIIVESMNRVARDFAGLAHLALPVWRQEGKIIYSLMDGMMLDENRINEAIINSQMTWGGIGKLEEIAKGKEALKGKIALGYLAGSTPEWIGAKSSGGRGIDYRKLFALGQAAGLNEVGNLNDQTAIGSMFKKDNKWANLWYLKMLQYEKAGVLVEWLENVDSVNNFIVENGGEYPRRFFNTKPTKLLLDRTRGYFGYPAGVNLAGTRTFVKFGSPLKWGIEKLANDKDFVKNRINTFVTTKELSPAQVGKLSIIQTQPRARGKLV
jgi:hypothetical protein